MQVITEDRPTLQELQTQTAWLRLLALPILRAELRHVLTNEKRRAVYELSTGEATTRDVATAAGVGAGTVSRWWAEWAELGLMRPAGRQGRMAHLASLRNLGIEGESNDRRSQSDDGEG
jgi:transposase-like protein